MKHQDFWMRAVSLLLTVGALGVYQVYALDWQAQEEENQLEISEAEAYNAEQQSLLDAAAAATAYADGTYTGSGEGFGGTISVEVTVSGGAITAIDITSASGEDSAYLDKAKQIIDSIIAAQSADVDTISGATFSSTGIRTAVQNALADAKEAAAAATDTADTSASGVYTDGTYTGSGEGFGGTISVEVTVSGGAITAINITSASGEDSAYLDKAKQIIDSIIAAQSADVDTISGATFSSTGIRTAVQNALEGAVS